MRRNRIFYLVFLALCAAMLFFTKAHTVMALVYALAALPVLFFILNKIAPRFIKLTQSLDVSSVLIGEEARYQLVIKNTGFLFIPAFSYIKPQGKAVISLSVAPREECVDEMNVSFPHRGIYNLLPREAAVRDYFGMFKTPVPTENILSVTVYPRIAEISNFPISNNLVSNAYSQFELMTEDYANLADLRQYEPSDSMKRVHWKVSAKRSELIVKNFESSALNSAMVYVDTRKIPGNAKFRSEAEDKIAELAVCVSNYSLKKQIPLVIHFGAEEITARNMREFERVYAMSAVFEFDGNDDISERLQLFFNDESFGCNIIVIASALTQKLADTLLKAKSLGHHIVLLHVPAEDESGAVAAGLLDMGINLIRVGIGDSISKIFS